MPYLEAPDNPSGEQAKQILTKSIFLAGGITGCWNWQEFAVKKLSMIPDLFILNPRRIEWDSTRSQEAMGVEQIAWEYNLMSQARQLMFWFTKDTVQPITLFELGKELGERYTTGNEGYSTRPLFVGMDTLYCRALDVREQMKLVAPDVPIYHDLNGMLDAILHYNRVNETLQKATQHIR